MYVVFPLADTNWSVIICVLENMDRNFITVMTLIKRNEPNVSKLLILIFQQSICQLKLHFPPNPVAVGHVVAKI